MSKTEDKYFDDHGNDVHVMLLILNAIPFLLFSFFLLIVTYYLQRYGNVNTKLNSISANNYYNNKVPKIVLAKNLRTNSTNSTNSSISYIKNTVEIFPRRISSLRRLSFTMLSCTVLYTVRVVGISIVVYYRVRHGEDRLLSTYGLLIRTLILVFIPQAIPVKWMYYCMMQMCIWVYVYLVCTYISVVFCCNFVSSMY